MKYLMLIYGSESHIDEMTPEQKQRYFARFGPFTQDLIKAGVLRGGDPLLPTSAATSVKLRDSKTVTTHGPFAETTEQLLGFYTIECQSLEEATAFAARCPTAEFGTIELRPVMEMPN